MRCNANHMLFKNCLQTKLSLILVYIILIESKVQFLLSTKKSQIKDMTIK